LNGCIISLIKKVNNKVSLSYHPVSKRSLPKTVAQKGKRKFEGHGKNIQKLIILAQLNKIEYDVIIYFGDTDKEELQLYLYGCWNHGYLQMNKLFIEHLGVQFLYQKTLNYFGGTNMII
jgi:hypothetical protein